MSQVIWGWSLVETASLSKKCQRGYICWTFLHYVFLNVSSSSLPDRVQNCTGCICLTLCIFKCVLKLSAQVDAKSHWLHLFDFFHRMFLNVSSNGMPASMHIHTDCICLISFDCVFKKSLQIVWARALKRTPIAIVSLSTVLNQMLLQTARCVFFRCFFKVTASEDALSVIIRHTNGTCRTSFQLCF